MPKKDLTLEEAIVRAEKFSDNYVKRGPYKFFPELEVVKEVQLGLAENEMKFGFRYCP